MGIISCGLKGRDSWGPSGPMHQRRNYPLTQAMPARQRRNYSLAQAMLARQRRTYSLAQAIGLGS